ncbi:MAG: ECF transporter S component [Chloroflexi bacterium]|nr:ECF transporter S component [Chloroflexota bacterium]
MRKSLLVLAIMFAIGTSAFVAPMFPDSPLNGLMSWGLISTLLIGLVILAFYFEFEERALSSKEIVLVVMLGTLAAALRIPFAALPGIQPCTYLIVCSGYVFGPVAGFMVGATTALLSNFFLGQGPWTPYQMIAWGFAGTTAAYLGRLKLSSLWLVAFGTLWGYLFGWITNTWFWAAFVYPLTFKTFLVTQVSSIWFDTAHAIGNALFLGIFGGKTIAILERFRSRFNWVRF